MKSWCYLLLPAALAGCDWVDSTGRQPGDTDVVTDEVTLSGLPPGTPLRVLEDQRRRFVVERAGRGGENLDYRIDPQPIEEGALDRCLSLEGFDPALAARSLDEACADGAECRLEVARDEAAAADTGELAFELWVPALRAPVGLRLRLLLGRSVTDDAANGESADFIEDDVREIDFCFVSINDAPSATADTYVVVEGGTLEVGVDDGVLANDSDDDDAGNAPLAVALSRAPERAVDFALDADGAFSYSAPEGLDADALDSFEYTLSDGIARPESAPTATVTVRVVVGNQPPMQSAPLPVVEARVGEPLFVDFADAFVDPESNPLSFAFLDPLPSGGDLMLDPSGVLGGTPGAGDDGDYLLALQVSDGGAQTVVDVEFTIQPAAVDLPPQYEAGTVFSQSIALGNAITPVRPVFTDPEGEALVYRLVGTALPFGVALDTTTGVVSGRPRFRGLTRGIRIEASDPIGGAAQSGAFSIRVR